MLHASALNFLAVLRYSASETCSEIPLVFVQRVFFSWENKKSNFIMTQEEWIKIIRCSPSSLLLQTFTTFLLNFAQGFK